MSGRVGFGKVLTVLTGGGIFLNLDDQLPVVKINEDDSLLSHWRSEDFGASDTSPECKFWRFNVTYDATLCNHFTIGRSASSPTRAHNRAMACAAAYGTECILSPEVGLAIPAAFIMDHESKMSKMNVLLAPRILPHEDDDATIPEQHVRVSPPDGDGLTDTKTFLFNRTIKIEYLDGRTRRMETRELSETNAYCVQLLRSAFESSCWESLD